MAIDLTTLTAAQIEILRKEYLADYVDQHPEWGTAPNVASTGAVGDDHIHLRALGVGTINAGTRFVHVAGGVRRDSYAVTMSIPIVANAATVFISPLLIAPAVASERIEVEPILKSDFNRHTRRQFFDDTQLRAFAVRAWDTYGERIAGAPDPVRTLYKIIRTYAYDEMLSGGSAFVAALLANDSRGNGARLLDRMVADRERDLADLNTGNRGHQMVFLER